MHRMALAVLLTSTLAAPAQQVGSGFGGGTGGGGSSSSRGSSSSGGSSAGSSSNLLSAGITGDTLLGGFSSSGSRGTRSNNISNTNAFYQYYGNPYAAGLPNNPVVGGFGTPIANLTGGSSGGSSFGGGTSGGFGSSSRTQGATGGFGSSMSRTSTSGGGSGFSGGGSNLGFTGGSGSSFGSGSASPFGSGGNTGGMAGNFGSGNSQAGAMNRGNRGTTGTANTASGMMGRNAGMQNSAPAASTGLRPGILYSTTPRFASARPTIAQVRNDVEGLLVGSGRFASAGGMRVDLDGPVVVLRGRVADDDQRRLAENMARLSPGVREVRNELEIRP